jgi:uncharacterized repeat protein (TIGR03803 family)
MAGGLVEGSDGNLYGTTYTGGLGGANNAGTIFKITPGGTLTTLYNFCSVAVGSVCKDGLDSKATLVQDTNGDLYGTSLLGGSKGSGTVFKLIQWHADHAQQPPFAGLRGASPRNRRGTLRDHGRNRSQRPRDDL